MGEPRSGGRGSCARPGRRRTNTRSARQLRGRRISARPGSLRWRRAAPSCDRRLAPSLEGAVRRLYGWPGSSSNGRGSPSGKPPGSWVSRTSVSPSSLPPRWGAPPSPDRRLAPRTPLHCGPVNTPRGYTDPLSSGTLRAEAACQDLTRPQSCPGRVAAAPGIAGKNRGRGGRFGAPGSGPPVRGDRIGSVGRSIARRSRWPSASQPKSSRN